MTESDQPRLMLQFKAKVSHAIVLAGEAGPEKGGALTVPPGRLRHRRHGPVRLPHAGVAGPEPPGRPGGGEHRHGRPVPHPLS